MITDLRNNDGAWMKAEFPEGRGDCFYCGVEVRKIAVVWSGLVPDSVITLHPTCAKNFGGELIGDGRTGERIINGMNILAGMERSLINDLTEKWLASRGGN